jgi:uncharacterized protein YfcZ (UPF0381/DUF406 family)
MKKYYINYSYASCNYLIKKVSEDEKEAGKIIQIFSDKRKAEEFLKKLEESEEKNGIL